MAENNALPPTKVGVSLGLTINLGNFESFRMDFSTEDYKREGESAKEAHERVFNFTHKRLMDKVAEVRSELANG